jgi:hypothetical protein
MSSFAVGVVHLYKVYSKKELKIDFKLIFHFIIQFVGAILCFYITMKLNFSLVNVILFAALFFILLALLTGLKKFISNQL